MRRRLTLSTALIALAAVIVLGVPLGAVESARARSDTLSRLEREADAVAGAIDDRLETHRPVLPALLRRVSSASHRIVVITRTGRTITTRGPLAGSVIRAHAGSGVAASVVAEAPSAELDRRVHRVWLLIAALGIGGVLTSVALAALQARRLARPLEVIARRSAQLGEGDFSVRAGSFDVPEIDAIAHGLDSSAVRIAELVGREREFSANVSHQLRTPLTALRLRLEEVARIDDPAARGRELSAALDEADRLEATIADLLAYARAGSGGRPVAVNLTSVAHEHAGTWRPMFVQADRILAVAGTRNVTAHASRGTVGQVLDVLLHNALVHGSGGVQLEVGRNGRFATVTVTDAGDGVAAQDQERVFERGASRVGSTGIGLHLARTLAQADGGSLVVLSDRPAAFELRLPLSPRA
jgi:signal transduction histidine kinase